MRTGDVNVSFDPAHLVDQGALEALGERALWAAVLWQAINDAQREGAHWSAQIPRERALTWIEDGAADFREVCELAGLDPSKTRRGILDLLRRPAAERRCRARHAGANMHTKGGL